jgi:hypothetical protein
MTSGKRMEPDRFPAQGTHHHGSSPRIRFHIACPRRRNGRSAGMHGAEVDQTHQPGSWSPETFGEDRPTRILNSLGIAPKPTLRFKLRTCPGCTPAGLFSTVRAVRMSYGPSPNSAIQFLNLQQVLSSIPQCTESKKGSRNSMDASGIQHPERRHSRARILHLRRSLRYSNRQFRSLLATQRLHNGFQP